MARVLVVGGGIAGLWTAVKAADAGHTVELVTKAELADGNTRHAQGGIAAALFPDDSAERHYDDTIAAGAGLSDPVISLLALAVVIVLLRSGRYATRPGTAVEPKCSIRRAPGRAWRSAASTCSKRAVHAGS